MTVTLITKDAEIDEFTAQDYRDMYDELRQGRSLGDVVALLKSAVTRSMWHQYEHGERKLNRNMRSELRVALGKPPLLPTVAEATAQASPNAAVWMVGDGVPQHVIMVASTPTTLVVNGTVQDAAQTSNVTGVTRGYIQRKRYVRPCVPFEYATRLKRLKTVQWLDVIEAGLSALEAQR